MEKLTEKQQRVLEFIQEKVRSDIPPTIREIARELGFSSTGTVRDYLNALESKGYLKRGQNRSRAIELLKSTFSIPIISTINAGRPDLAYEDPQGYIDPDDLFLGRLSQKDVFALKVKGDSMVDAGIMEGDFAVMIKQAAAHNGDIVAALLDNHEVTLKRLRQKSARFYLEPANRNYQPIYQDFSVIGKLITIIRKY